MYDIMDLVMNCIFITVMVVAIHLVYSLFDVSYLIAALIGVPSGYLAVMGCVLFLSWISDHWPRHK